MHNCNIIIETDRLLIRPFRLEDIEASYQINLDPEVTKYTGDGGVVDLKEMERRIVEHVFGDYQKYGYGRLAIEWKASGQFIGFTGLKYLEDSQEVDLGYRLAKDFWGKGIATESGKSCLEYGFQQLGLQRIIAMAMPENIGSLRVLEKLGFHYEKELVEEGQLVQQFAIFNS